MQEKSDIVCGTAAFTGAVPFFVEREGEKNTLFAGKRAFGLNGMTVKKNKKYIPALDIGFFLWYNCLERLAEVQILRVRLTRVC
ncbi:MAG: hypothetical protein IKC65_03335 [Lentisphaeria bacterium]|nr:hypothetical protein [Lentisphaeria bacterium]